jgi:hypothetical protein
VLVLYGSDATKSSVNASANTISIFLADIFLDLPIGKKENKMAVTGYSVFYDYDFGPNYLRNVAIMNIGSVDPNFTGSRALAVLEMQAYYGSETFGTHWNLLPSKTDKPKFTHFGLYL